MTNDNATNATLGIVCTRYAADMFETTSLIGKVTEVRMDGEAFAPDCTTWITVRRDEHDEPKVGDFIARDGSEAVAIHSQPNAHLSGGTPTAPRLFARRLIMNVHFQARRIWATPQDTFDLGDANRPGWERRES